MESTINRKDYRRDYQKNEEITVRTRREEVDVKPKASLSKIINLMLLFLSILLLKFFHFDDCFTYIKTNLNTGISYEEIIDIVQNEYMSIPLGEKSFIETSQEENINTENDNIQKDEIVYSRGRRD